MTGIAWFYSIPNIWHRSWLRQFRFDQSKLLPVILNTLKDKLGSNPRMDVPRSPSVARKKKIKRGVYIALALVSVVAVSVALKRLKPAAPTVERATVIIDQVKRGDIPRQVRGIGTLVPEDIRWIPAVTSGRVERRLVQPGAFVGPGTVLMELSNAELQQSLAEAESQMRSAEAAYKNREVELRTLLLAQQSQIATVQSDLQQAKVTAEANEELSKDGLISNIVVKQSRTRMQELSSRADLEQKRLSINNDAIKTQLAVQQALLDERRTRAQLLRQQVDQLKVRAGMSGVLQLLAVEVGQQVQPGTNLARVSDPQKLKAEVRIAETQARDITIGQSATIDTRNGVIPGRVIRIDPAAQNGTVAVDIALDGALPKGARPDLSVDGTVELERLENILYTTRPGSAQDFGTITLFKLEADGQHASRVQVKLGRSSVTTIELKEGLQLGDQVIVSDMAQWDNVNRIRLN